MGFWRLHYHLVWGTYGREPLMDPARETLIHQTVYGKAKELGVLIHAVGGIEDHIHMVVSIPPRLSVAECVGKLRSQLAPSEPGDPWRGVSMAGWLRCPQHWRTLAGIRDRLRAQSTGASRGGTHHRHLRTLHGGGRRGGRCEPCVARLELSGQPARFIGLSFIQPWA
jgi:hypothetical protein